VNFKSISLRRKLVKYLQLISEHQHWRKKYMKQQITIKARKELETKMAAVFSEKFKNLSTELQRTLLDDMVTAFENRLNVLNHANTKSGNKAA
jgi:hypothetical protein